MIIVNREEFGKEANKYVRGEEVNEGLLQFLKSFLKKDWQDIKSKNSLLKDELEKIDGKLEGFTIVKRSNFDACTRYRQALCDFANDLLDGKLEELEKNNSLKKVVMGISDDEDKMKSKLKNSPELESIIGRNSIRDKSLNDKLNDSANALDEIVKSTPQIAQWASAMKRSVKNLINDIIISKSDSDDKEAIQKAVDNKKKEDEKYLKQIDDLEFKTQKEKIKELEDSRKDALTKMGVTPYTKSSGKDAAKDLKDEFFSIIKPIIGESLITKYDFNSIINEGYKSISTLQKKVENDSYFGLPKIIEAFIDSDFNDVKNYYEQNDDEDDDDFVERIKKRVVNIYFKELNDIYDRITEVAKEDSFNDVPGDAVQAMYMGLALAVGYGLTGKSCETFFLSDENMDLMTRCCIESDATIGYSFPLVDEKNPKLGTIFVALMGILANAKNENKVFNVKTDAKLLEAFKKNMATLFKKITDKAGELKKEAEEQREKEADALKKKEEQENK